MVPALLIPRQKAPKTHNYKVSLDNGLTLEFASDKLLNDKEVQDVVDGMNADGTIEKMALAANKKKAATKAANEKQAAKMDKANRDLELLKSQTKNAQRKAREASMGYNIGESIIGAAKAVEANPAVKEFNRIMKMVDSNLPGGRILEAGINALPPEAKKVVKGIRDSTTPTSLVTGTAETIGSLLSRPEKTSYEQYGVAFDPKADPVQRLAAAVNIIGTAFSVGGATRTIAKKLPSQAELKALQDALTATKGRKATRGEAFNEFQKLRKLSEEQAKATAKATAAAAVASAKAAKAAKAGTTTTPPTGAATTGTPKAKPKSRTATATTAPTGPTATTATPSATGPAAATPNPQPATTPTGAPTGTPSATTATRTMADVDKELKDLEVKLQEALAKNDFDPDEFQNLLDRKGDLFEEYLSLITSQQRGTTTATTTTGAATATPNPQPTASPTATPSGATTSTTAATTAATGTTPKAKPKSKPAGTTNTSAQSGGGTATATQAATSQAGTAAATQAATSQAAGTTAAATGPTGKAKPKSRPPRDDQPGGANNATTDAMRQGEGLGPVESNVKNFREDGTTSDNYDFNDYQSRLKDIAENGSKSKPLDQEEVSNWKSHRSELKRRIAAVGKKIKEGDTSPETLKRLQDLQKQRDEADVALKSTGTMSSLSLGERRNIIRDSYLREDLEYKAIAANDGPLTKEQQLKLDELIQKEENFALKSDGMDALDELTRKEAEKFIANLGDTAKKAGTKAQRDAAWAELRQAVLKMGSKASAGIAPDDLVKIASSIRKVARAYYRLDVDLDGLVKIVLEDTKRKFPQLVDLDRDDILRALAGREGDRSVYKRNSQDVDELANRVEIDTYVREIKTAAERRNMSKTNKVLANVGDFFRGAKAGFDLSAVGNQGLQMWAMNPRASLRASKAMLRAMKSDKDFYQVMGELRLNPYYDLAVASKLKANGVNVLVDDIPMANSLIDRLPGAKPSNRAYNAYLNVVRMEAFADMMDSMKTGSAAPTLAEADIAAKFVNVATGSGTGDVADALNKINKKTHNMFFFAPGYRVAKAQFTLGRPLADAYKYGKATKNWKPVEVVAKKYARLLSVYASAYGAVAASGGKVDMDMRSPNFLMVKIGKSDTWVDPTGGSLGFMRAVAKSLGGAKSINKTTGEIKKDKNGKDILTEPSPRPLANYLVGGLGPVPRMAFGALSGESFGKEINIKTQKGRENIVSSSLAPIWLEQSLEVLEDKKLSADQKAALVVATYLGATVDTRGKAIPRQ